VLAMHSSSRNKRGGTSSSSSSRASSTTSFLTSLHSRNNTPFDSGGEAASWHSDAEWRASAPLSESLHLSRRERADLDPVPHVLLRKYVAYAKKHIRPVISAEAQQVLADFYLETRAGYSPEDSLPVTVRYLESLIRLSEARARIELRGVVTEQDAHHVIEIMKEAKGGPDDIPSVDFRPMNQTSLGNQSKNKQMQGFFKALEKKARQRKDNVFTTGEMKGLAGTLGIGTNFHELVQKLNNQNYLLSKGSGKYQIRGSM
jgi:DNA helicase MCM8